MSALADGSGRAVPKQFCSLNGGASLLEETFDRAHAFSTERRTLVVVAAEHRAHWHQALNRVPRENVLVQPANRGTANGVLLGLTAIMARDPNALVTILPGGRGFASDGLDGPRREAADAALSRVGKRKGRWRSLANAPVFPEKRD